MELQRTIAFSMVVHATFAVAATSLVGRDMARHVPPPAVTISLVPSVDAGPQDKPAQRSAVPVAPVARPVTRPKPQAVQPAMPALHPHTAPAKNETAAPPVVPNAGGERGGGAVGDEKKGFSLMPSAGTVAGGSASSFTTSGGPVQATASRQAAPAGSGEGNAAALRSIRAAIERARSYPYQAKRRGIEGTATTSFSIGPAGLPQDVRIVKSSGSDLLDTAARETIGRAAPFPSISGTIEVPIVFRLER